jgi:UDP-glucose 4-epimerase
LPISEDAPLHPISPYGQAKLAIEQLCAQYGREHGLELAVVRLFSIFGRGLRKQLFWDACRKFCAGDGCFGGTGEERRDWLHVDDAVRLINAASMRASAMVPIVNGGGGQSIKVRDALTQLRALLPAPVPEITFSGNARAGDPSGYEADITRARAWGWAPARAFSEGLADYISWAHGALS